ncbi:acyltransferase family protein [Methyloterricola oryzae]|uniref:acyltransferase family protein n=1 Tax=Methyloterricola oryzae TaxID=1495050 RepID=UPI00130121EC|nr:acyltransferase family protein [Methyloterricola oryzae]
MEESRICHLSRDEIDTIKGIYILLIVIGHNLLLTSLYQGLFVFLYNFHVYGFLLLPFVFPAKKISRDLVINLSVRYLVPFVVFYSISSLMYFPIYIGAHSLWEWFGDFILGLIVNDAYWVKKTTGFQLFWFLPTFFTLTLFRSLLNSFASGIRQSVLLLLFVAHITVGCLPDWAKLNIPFGIGIVAYIYILGESISCDALLSATRSRYFSLITVPVLLMLFFLSSKFGLRTNLAWLNLMAISDVILLLLHDGIVVISFLTVLSLSRSFKKLPYLSCLGKFSLQIYLTHSFVFYFFYMLVYPLASFDDPLLEAVVGIGSLLFTVAVTLLLSILASKKMGLYKMIFPSSRSDLPFFRAYSKVT